MPAINLIITNAGRALLPANGGIAPVLLTQLGLTSTAVVPNAALVALAGEFKRINTVSGAVTSPDTISLAVIDETNDTYDLRAIGLYTSTGVLFAVAGQAEPIVEKASQSNVALALDLKFADIAATELEFGDANFLLPAATTERQGLVELATDAEVAAKTDSTRAVTAKSLWFAFSAWVAAAFSDVWRASNDGSGSGLDADLLDGLQGAAYAKKAGETFTGDVRVPSLYATQRVSAGDLTGGGFARISGSDANTSGYMELYFANGTRAGYIIANATNISLVAEAGNYYNFNQGPAVGGLPLWYAGNDGAGSGLDADMLDGLQLSLICRADTIANPARGQAIVLATDAASMGIEGAPLQIREKSYGGMGTGALDTAPAIAFHWQGRYASSLRMDANGHFRFVDGGNSYREVYAHAFFALGGGAQVWNAGNDGAGSGLDADLLDGLEGSAYAKKAGETFTGNVLAPNVFSSGAISSGGSLYGVGGVTLHAADAVHSGFVSFTDKDGVRSGYIGYSAGTTIDIVADGSFVYNWNKSFTVAGNAAWHAGNDGAGSGMDADLLDGLQGSAYALRSNTVTFTSIVSELGDGSGILYFGSTLTRYLHYASGMYYLAGAPLSVNGSLAWTAGNDGAGSGADADLLDGQDGSWYTNVVYHLGYVPLNQTSYTAADVLSKLLGVDGSGSGLDADMLDGHHASDFVLNGASSWGGNAAEGWRTTPDGFIEQWKQGSWDVGGPEASPQTIYYPVPYANNSFDVQVTTLLSSNNNVTDSFYQLISFDHEKCVVVKQRTTGNDSVSIAPRIKVIGR